MRSLINLIRFDTSKKFGRPSRNCRGSRHVAPPLQISVSLRAHLQVKPPRIARGALNRVVEIQFFRSALSGETAQPPQRGP